MRWLPVKPTEVGIPWPVLHHEHVGLNDGDADIDVLLPRKRGLRVIAPRRNRQAAILGSEGLSVQRYSGDFATTVQN